MIKGERQYRFIKVQANRFSQTLQSLGETDGVHPLIVKAQREALSSQIAEAEDPKSHTFAISGGYHSMGSSTLSVVTHGFVHVCSRSRRPSRISPKNPDLGPIHTSPVSPQPSSPSPQSTALPPASAPSPRHRFLDTIAIS